MGTSVKNMFALGLVANLSISLSFLSAFGANCDEILSGVTPPAYNWNFDFSSSQNWKLEYKIKAYTSFFKARDIDLSRDKKGTLILTPTGQNPFNFSIAPLNTVTDVEAADGSIYLIGTNWDQVEIVKISGSVIEKIEVENAPDELLSGLINRPGGYNPVIGRITIEQVDKLNEGSMYYLWYLDVEGRKTGVGIEKEVVDQLMKAADVNSVAGLKGFSKVIVFPGDMFNIMAKLSGTYEFQASAITPAETIFEMVTKSLIDGRAPDLSKFKREDINRALFAVGEDRKKLVTAVEILSGGTVRLEPMKNRYITEDLYRLIHPAYPNSELIINLLLTNSDFRNWPGSPMFNGSPRPHDSQ